MIEDRQNPDEPEIAEADLKDPDPRQESDGAEFAVPDTVLNLLPELRKKRKYRKFLETTFPEQILEHMKEGVDGRAAWMEKTRIRIRLWLGDLEPKKWPYANCANMHDPVTLSRCLRLVARMIGEIFQKGRPLFSAMSNSMVTTEQADAITRHQNHQFRREIPDFQRHCTRAAHAFIRDGDAIMDSYRDTERNVNCHDYLKHDRFVWPYAIESTATDMSDVPWKIKILYKYARQLRKLAAKGRYDARAVADLLRKGEGSTEDEIERPLLDQANSAEGADRNSVKRDPWFTLLEYHGWMMLPGQKEDIPVIAVLDKGTSKLLAVYSRYYNDPVDQARFDRQQEQYEAYLAETQMFSQAMEREAAVLARIQQPEGALDAAGMPIPAVPPEEASTIVETIERERPPVPVRPDWMDETDGPPKPCRQKIIERFTHMVCIENPDGNYGIGVGLVIEPHQMAMNAMLNQVVDQATAANAPPQLKHQSMQLPPDTTSLEPGAIIEVTGIPPGTLRDNLVAVNVPPANPQLIQAVENQRRAVDDVSSAPGIMSGERSPDEPFRGTAARLEQATKQLTMFATNFVGGMSNIARNNMLLDYQFVDEDAMIDVVDTESDKMVPLRLRRDFYRDQIDIVFSADLEFKSQAARVAEADDIVGLMTKGFPPQIATIIFPPKAYAEAARLALRARGAYTVLAMVNSDAEIEQQMQRQQAQAMAAVAGAAGAPPGKGPTPTIPTGQAGGAPGERPPQTRLPPGVAPQGAPMRTK